MPALTGLGAPHWDPQARGSIHGITRGTTRAHLVRATLEAICFEVRDVFGYRDSRSRCASRLRRRCPAAHAASGGSARRAGGTPQDHVDTTGLGAAFLAGLGTGVWSSQEEIAATWALERRFEPARGARKAADAAYRQWLKAVERSKAWEEQPAR